MLAQDQVRITFPDLTADRASILAKELEHELIRAGVSRTDVRTARDHTDTQDLGATVLVAAGGYLAGVALDVGREFAKGVAHRAGREALDWLIKKWDTRAVITMSTGRSVTVGEAARSPGRTVPSAVHHQLSEMKSLGLVILGASAFPNMPADKRLDNPAFKRSADLARRLFSPKHTVFRSVAVLDLFDQDLRSDQIVDRIEEHVTANPDIRDVVIYYCGHGDFQKDKNRSYYLLLRGTQVGREPMTSLRLDDFRYMIEQKDHLHDKRCYMVLDCCFAGAAVEAFQSGDPGTLVANQLDDMVVPGRGWAFLTASDRSLPAIGDDKAGFTMFTGALGDVLLGRSNAPARMTLGDLCDAATRRIKSKHGTNAAIPQCHAPQQNDGDVSRIPLFLVDDGKAGRPVAAPAVAPAPAPPAQPAQPAPPGGGYATGYPAAEPTGYPAPPRGAQARPAPPQDGGDRWGGGAYEFPQQPAPAAARPAAQAAPQGYVPQQGDYDFGDYQSGYAAPASATTARQASWPPQAAPAPRASGVPQFSGYAQPSAPASPSQYYDYGDQSPRGAPVGVPHPAEQQGYEPEYVDDEEPPRRRRRPLMIIVLLIGAIAIGFVAAKLWQSMQRSSSPNAIIRRGDVPTPTRPYVPAPPAKAPAKAW